MSFDAETPVENFVARKLTNQEIMEHAIELRRKGYKASQIRLSLNITQSQWNQIRVHVDACVRIENSSMHEDMMAANIKAGLNQLIYMNVGAKDLPRQKIGLEAMKTLAGILGLNEKVRAKDAPDGVVNHEFMQFLEKPMESPYQSKGGNADGDAKDHAGEEDREET